MNKEFRKDGDILVCLAISDTNSKALALMKKDPYHKIMIKVFYLDEEEPLSLDDVADTEDLWELGLPWGHIVKCHPKEKYVWNPDLRYSYGSLEKEAEHFAEYAEYLADYPEEQ